MHRSFKSAGGFFSKLGLVWSQPKNGIIVRGELFDLQQRTTNQKECLNWWLLSCFVTTSKNYKLELKQWTLPVKHLRGNWIGHAPTPHTRSSDHGDNHTCCPISSTTENAGSATLLLASCGNTSDLILGLAVFRWPRQFL